jgi:hypothetical protein
MEAGGESVGFVSVRTMVENVGFADGENVGLAVGEIVGLFACKGITCRAVGLLLPQSRSRLTGASLADRCHSFEGNHIRDRIVGEEGDGR